MTNLITNLKKTFPKPSGLVLANLSARITVAGTNTPVRLFNSAGVLLSKLGTVLVGVNGVIDVWIPGRTLVDVTLFVTASGLTVSSSSSIDAQATQVPSTLPVLFDTSRALHAGDNGATLEVVGSVTITVPAGLPRGFDCTILPAATTLISASTGVLLNGAGTTLTRLASSNPIVSIIGRISAIDRYVVSGS
jgi:hypothetical protein